jgi:hypothetical protein
VVARTRRRGDSLTAGKAWAAARQRDDDRTLGAPQFAIVGVRAVPYATAVAIAIELIHGVHRLARLLRHTSFEAEEQRRQGMQATIERDTTQLMTRRQVVVDVAPERLTTPYRAPLATFLALVASGRASACTAQMVDRDNLMGAHA